MTQSMIIFSELVRLATVLNEAATRVDRALLEMPERIHAGPLAAEVGTITDPLIAQCMHFVIRTRVAAIIVLASLYNYEVTEATNTEIGTILESTVDGISEQ